MDFVYAIVTETFDLVVPVPGEESRLFAFIRPFQPMVTHSQKSIFYTAFIT